MPTRHAVGVTATLSVANLGDTLTDQIDLRQGTAHKEATKRIRTVFSTGRVLLERPIGFDGNENDVVHFIGEQQDMPFCMVQAGPHITVLGKNPRLSTPASLEGINPSSDAPPTPETPRLNLPDASNAPDGAMKGFSLPSNADQPSIGLAPETSQQTVSQKADPTIKLLRMADNTYDEEPDSKPARSRPQALMLTVETSLKSHLPKVQKNLNQKTIQDMKIEIFLNGKLVDVAFINPRRAAVQISTDNKVHFHGTRVHRQVEKPWVYQQPDPAAATTCNAEQRWRLVNASLDEEANARGVNESGISPLTAQYLKALSKISLPDFIRDEQSFGVIDVVVLSGSGRKYSPEAGNITTPTRMHDPQCNANSWRLYGTLSNGNAMKEPQYDESEDTSVHTREAAGLLARPARRHLESSQAETPTTPGKRGSAERTQTFALSMGFDPRDMNLVVGDYVNSHGKKRNGRTLGRRLADVFQMSPSRRAKEIPKLRQELEEVKHAAPIEEPKGQEPSPKTEPEMLEIDRAASEEGNKRKHSATMLPQERADIQKAARGEEMRRDSKQELRATSAQTMTIADQKALPIDEPREDIDNGPKPLATLTTACPTRPIDRPSPANRACPILEDVFQTPRDPNAALAQARMDTALRYGAPLDGYLVKRIAALAPPNHPPIKRKFFAGPPPSPSATEESELQPSTRRAKCMRSAATPSPSPQKPQRRSTRKTAGLKAAAQTQTLRIANPDDEDTGEDAEGAVQGRGRRSAVGRGANRTVSQWIPGEPTPAEAVAAFQIPELCRGCVVSYAEGPAQRQIGKARPGEFTEDELVVGMRFVVV